MRLLIRAVGRLKTASEQQLTADYLKRAANLGRRLGIASMTLVELPESRAATVPLRRTEEAARLLAQPPARPFLVSLNEKGRQFTSIAFASELQRLIERGTQELVFLIGGPDGFAAEVENHAQLSLSLGQMTWPHALARVMLAEQIYRSVTILLNHPYHRD
jgi:23S rRNA (pseudouridine1915-N3)-methyltransferase